MNYSMIEINPIVSFILPSRSIISTMALIVSAILEPAPENPSLRAVNEGILVIGIENSSRTTSYTAFMISHTGISVIALGEGARYDR